QRRHAPCEEAELVMPAEDLLLEDHGDRLQDLERSTRDLQATVAGNQVGIDHLSRVLHDGFERVQEHLRALHSKLDAIGTTQADQHMRVTQLEATNTQRAARWRSVGRYALATLTSIALLVLGALVTMAFAG